MDDTLLPHPRPLYFGYGAHSRVALPYLRFVWVLGEFFKQISMYLHCNELFYGAHVQVGME
jgi:hypothetical protein